MMELDHMPRMTQGDNGGSRPVPDPTLLTTQQLIREQAGLKELVLSIVEGKFEVIGTHLTSVDHRLEQLHTEQGGFQKIIDSSVGQLQNLVSEKFNGAIEVVNEKITSLAN